MSRAERRTFRHCDPDHLEALLRKSDATTKIIVTDGVFSQDGDIAPLPEFLDLARRHDAVPMSTTRTEPACSDRPAPGSASISASPMSA